MQAQRANQHRLAPEPWQSTSQQMGLLACFSPAPEAPTAPLEQEVDRLKVELTSAQKNVAQLTTELQQIQTERVNLLEQLGTRPETPSMQDAATETPAVSVAVQVKPPVTHESRIPRPTSEEPKETEGAKQPVKSRIPAAPTVANNVAEYITRSPSRNSPRSPCRSARNLQIDPASPQATAAADANGVMIAVGPALDSTSEQPQRTDVLQQQLKVAEAFRLSLEAELRDARFANNNLQTQMLSLQTKFEKTVEDQVQELERLNNKRKEGQDSHEQAIQEVQALKQKLASSEKACSAAQQQAEAAAKLSAEHEQKLQEVSAQLTAIQNKLSSCMAELDNKCAELSRLAAQLQEAQQQATAAGSREKQLDAELKAQKALYDSTVEEMLAMSTNYNDLKQAYHKLQNETNNHDKMVQLVQQELSELSYYAAAGRVALGLAPSSTLRNFTPRGSEVSLSAELAHVVEPSQLGTPTYTAAMAAAAAADEAAAIVHEVTSRAFAKAVAGN